jgi:hypothetical protein
MRLKEDEMNRNTINARDPEPQVVDEEVMAPIMDMVRKVIREKERTEHKLAKKLQSNLNRVAEVRWGSSTSSAIAVRTGLFGKNSKDLARSEAAKSNEDLAKLLGRLLTDHGKLGVFGHQILTEARRVMDERDDELPDWLQTYGHALSLIGAEVLAQTYTEIMTMFPQLGLEEIARSIGP